MAGLPNAPDFEASFGLVDRNEYVVVSVSAVDGNSQIVQLASADTIELDNSQTTPASTHTLTRLGTVDFLPGDVTQEAGMDDGLIELVGLPATASSVIYLGPDLEDDPEAIGIAGLEQNQTYEVERFGNNVSCDFLRRPSLSIFLRQQVVATVFTSQRKSIRLIRKLMSTTRRIGFNYRPIMACKMATSFFMVPIQLSRSSEHWTTLAKVSLHKETLELLYCPIRLGINQVYSEQAFVKLTSDGDIVDFFRDDEVNIRANDDIALESTGGSIGSFDRFNLEAVTKPVSLAKPS